MHLIDVTVGVHARMHAQQSILGQAALDMVISRTHLDLTRALSQVVSISIKNVF